MIVLMSVCVYIFRHCLKGWLVGFVYHFVGVLRFHGRGSASDARTCLGCNPHHFLQ